MSDDDDDDGSNKKLVGVRIKDSRRLEWKEFVEESSEFSSMASLIRTGVERVIEEESSEGKSKLERDMDSLLEDMHTVTSLLYDVEDSVYNIEDDLEDVERDIVDEMFAEIGSSDISLEKLIEERRNGGDSQ